MAGAYTFMLLYKKMPSQLAEPESASSLDAAKTTAYVLLKNIHDLLAVWIFNHGAIVASEVRPHDVERFQSQHQAKPQASFRVKKRPQRKRGGGFDKPTKTVEEVLAEAQQALEDMRLK
jgi:hypothetical protein